ncbi:MAG: hypothetical protein AB7P04_06595 [Bacteriovoracia bacterium]
MKNNALVGWVVGLMVMTAGLAQAETVALPRKFRCEGIPSSTAPDAQNLKTRLQKYRVERTDLATDADAISSKGRGDDTWGATLRDGKLVMSWFNCDESGLLEFELKDVVRPARQARWKRRGPWISTKFAYELRGDESTYDVRCRALY